jgi:hypothetical protein
VSGRQTWTDLKRGDEEFACLSSRDDAAELSRTGELRGVVHLSPTLTFTTITNIQENLLGSRFTNRN